MGAIVVRHNLDGTITVTDTRTLADAQNEALTRLANFYNSLYAAGFNYNGKNVQIDPASLQNVNAAASMAIAAQATNAAWPQSYVWITTDNSTLALTTAPAVIAFGVAIGNYVTTLIMTNRALKNAIAALTTIAVCDAFDVMQGWPSNAASG